jgi:hypothetical protein
LELDLSALEPKVESERSAGSTESIELSKRYVVSLYGRYF